MDRKDNLVKEERRRIRSNDQRKEIDKLAFKQNKSLEYPFWDYKSYWSNFTWTRSYDRKESAEYFYFGAYLDGWLEIYIYKDDFGMIYLNFYSYETIVCEEFNVEMVVDKEYAQKMIRMQFEDAYLEKQMEIRDNQYVASGYHCIH